MEASGETIQLAMSLADIFGGQIDFESDLQPGDTLRGARREVHARRTRSPGYGRDPRCAVRRRRPPAPGVPLVQSRTRRAPRTTTTSGRSLKRFMLRSPLKFEPRITSGFSRNRLHPIFRTYRAASRHRLRRADRCACRRGLVRHRWCPPDGPAAAAIRCRLRHSGGYETYYLHLSAFGPGIRAGAHVDQGQVIGRVGRDRRPQPVHTWTIVSSANGVFVNPLVVQGSLPPGDPIPPTLSALPSFSTRDDTARQLSTTAAGRGPDVAETRCRRRNQLTNSVRVPSPAGILAAPEPPARMAGWLPSIRSRHCVQRPTRPPSVSSVPYDVVSTDEARQLAAGNPLSFLHVTRSEIDLPPDADPYSSEVYDKARANLTALRAQAPLVVDDVPSLYFYRLRMGAHEQTGVAGCFSLDEYDRDIIKKHERTRRDKEDDRTRHIVELRAQTGVVFLTYRARADVDRLQQAVTSGAAALRLHRRRRRAAHRLAGRRRSRPRRWWPRSRAIPSLYIADGHHRAASAARARTELRRRRGRGRRGAAHVHRGGVSRQPDADPSVQPRP